MNDRDLIGGLFLLNEDFVIARSKDVYHTGLETLAEPLYTPMEEFLRDAKPVSISESRLAMTNLSKRQDHYYTEYKSGEEFWDFRVRVHPFEMVAGVYIGYFSGEVFLRRVTYMHQLQGLMYHLTGQELVFHPDFT